MNSWNFNELTQEDVLDYKACQRKDGSIYGIPNKSECQTGKEISKDDLLKLADRAEKGDKKAAATLKKVSEENKKVKVAERKKAAEEKKKKEAAEAEKKGKKGKKGKGGGKKGGGKKGGGKKGGAGKKGGGKSKGGSGKKGSGRAAKKSDAAASQRQAQRVARSNRVERQKAMRKRLADLQASLRKVKNPAVKKALEESMNDLLKGVAELSKTDSGAQQQQQPGSSAPSAPAPSAPATNEPKKES